MDKNKKEKMKNWLETGIRETDNERLIREKKSIEDIEKRENFIKHGKSMTDLEIINEANLKDITKKLLERLIEFEQIKLSSIRIGRSTGVVVSARSVSLVSVDSPSIRSMLLKERSVGKRQSSIGAREIWLKKGWGGTN